MRSFAKLRRESNLYFDMSQSSNFIDKLQKRWGLQSFTQVIVILIVFACTGFSVLYIKKPVFWLLGVDENLAWGWRALIYALTILPAYQVLLLMYGFIFGQFRFFWEFEKRMLRRMGLISAQTDKKSDNQVAH